jgi:uncharacterized protein (DUF362 family)
MVKVALIELGEDVTKSLQKALKLIGGIPDLNTPTREVLYKLGVFEPKQRAYTTVPVARAIIESFSQAPKIWLIESDNYRGAATERLQIWKDLFSERVVPFSLSEDPDTKPVDIAGEEMNLSQLLFDNRALISSHILRRYSKGSVIKNLFGLAPMKKKAVYHKNLETVVLDLFKAVGGIDLAVIDGTYAFASPGASVEKSVPANVIIVGRDAVAVDAVGCALMGKDPRQMKMVKMAKKQGLGEADLDKIEIVGDDFEENKERIKSAILKKKIRY